MWTFIMPHHEGRSPLTTMEDSIARMACCPGDNLASPACKPVFIDRRVRGRRFLRGSVSVLFRGPFLFSFLAHCLSSLMFGLLDSQNVCALALQQLSK
jgi:hypothetical protein